MAKFQQGQSGNPSGRPPKSQALTDLLTKALSKTVETKDGKISGKRLIALLMAEAATTGKVQFPGDDTPSQIGVKDWYEIVKWIYERVDGKPMQPITGEGGGPIETVVKIVKGVSYDDL